MLKIKDIILKATPISPFLYPKNVVSIIIAINNFVNVAIVNRHILQITIQKSVLNSKISLL